MLRTYNTAGIPGIPTVILVDVYTVYYYGYIYRSTGCIYRILLWIYIP
jgi:hypothetical protein